MTKAFILQVDYERGATTSLLPRFPAIIERYRVLIFSGDVDACVPYIGTQSWTYQVAEENGYTVESEVGSQRPAAWCLLY